MVSIVIITIGCFVASAGDLEFDKYAYLAGLTSVFAQGGYLTLVQLASSREKSVAHEDNQVNILQCTKATKSDTINFLFGGLYIILTRNISNNLLHFFRLQVTKEEPLGEQKDQPATIQ